jgi:hypothetical protein
MLSTRSNRKKIYLDRRKSGRDLRWLWLGLSFLAVVVVSATVGMAIASFFKDDTPPQIILFSPTEAQVCKGDITLDFGVGDNRSKIKSVTVNIDGETFPIEEPKDGFGHYRRFNLQLDTTKLSEGTHHLVINSVNDEGAGLESSLAIDFVVDNIVVRLQLSTDKTTVKPGGTLYAVLQSNEPCEITEAYLGDEQVYFYPQGNNWESLLPVRLSKEPGEEELTVKIKRSDGEEETLSQKITIVYGDYEKEYIEIDASLAGANVPEWILTEEQKKVDTVVLTCSADQLWSGPFIVPVEGKITSPFGSYRKYSYGAEARHLGVDIAAPEGTPVKACADGVVAFAEKLSLYGNCIIIDHGRGLHSLYHHLSKILVTVDQPVKQGDIIGEVGSTGMATGPHLHWQVSIGRWVVNPFDWTKENFTYNHDIPAENKDNK